MNLNFEAINALHFWSKWSFYQEKEPWAIFICTYFIWSLCYG